MGGLSLGFHRHRQAVRTGVGHLAPGGDHIAGAAAGGGQQSALPQGHPQLNAQDALLPVDGGEVGVRGDAEHRTLLMGSVIGHILPDSGLLAEAEDDADAALQRYAGI